MWIFTVIDMENFPTIYNEQTYKKFKKCLGLLF